jgi:hypothetical protein
MLRERLIAPTVASIYLGLVAIVCGAGGVLAGGYAGDALSRRVRAGHALVVGVSFIASVPVGLVALFIPSQLMFMALTAVAAFLFSVYNGPIAAAVDEMGPRAYATTLQANFLLMATPPRRSRRRSWGRWSRSSCRASCSSPSRACSGARRFTNSGCLALTWCRSRGR